MEGGGGSEELRWLVNAKMMNVRMVNESESYLQLGRHNADNISLTELLCSSLSSSPVVARLSPGCEAYVELVSDWQPFVPVPCLHGVGAHIASIGWSEYVLLTLSLQESDINFSISRIESA